MDVKELKEDQKNLIQFYIDIGVDDFLSKGNSFVHTTMRDLKIPHEYRFRHGAPTWVYWNSRLPNVLMFVSKRFRRKQLKTN